MIPPSPDTPTARVVSFAARLRRAVVGPAPIAGRDAAGQASRLALGVGFGYAALGIVWILSSDRAAALLYGGAATLARAQQIKGVGYVVVTALLLALLVGRGQARLLRARAAAALRELQVRDLFEGHPQPMWVEDAGGRVLAANRAACARYGYREDEFLGLAPAALERPDATGDAAGAVCHATRAGERLFVRLRRHPLSFDGRDAVLVMVDEVTQQVLSERRVRQHERRIRQLHQSLGEVLWLASPDGRELYYVSPAYETIYGRRCAELLAEPSGWLTCVHPDDAALAVASMQTMLAVGRSSCEYRIVRPDGTIRWISDRKRLIVDEDGGASMIGGIGEDITAAKERDAALATTNAELERRVASRTAELGRANAELQQANAELDAFARTAAHDLKSPLAGIAGFAALLRLHHGAGLGVDGLETVQRIERSSQQMAQLVGDLLVLSRSATVALSLRDVDLAALARELVDDLQAQEPERQVVFDAPPSLWANCDPGLARSLLANLLGNAWKYSSRRERATIRLRAERDGDQVRVSVEDDGAGFDASRAHRLFEPFQRLHSAREFSGTGVGLATCRRIVQRHGGEIAGESAPGRGAAFRFTLPAPVARHAAA